MHALPAVLFGPYRAVGTICNDRRFFPYAAGGLGGAKPPPAGLGQRFGGGPGAKPLGAPEIWHFKVQNTTQKLNSVVQFPCTK